MPILDLGALARRLPPSPLTRFAPNPTGYLHLGHVANAVFVWGIARALGGRVLLRIEDHDRNRCRPEYEAAIFEELDWLELDPDAGPEAALHSELRHPDRQCGDLLLQDRLGQWTYQFAVTVDDLRHGVDLVIRGKDLLASTGRQIQLARLLGRGAPAIFVHHRLITNDSGAKLSKARRDTGVRELRAAGVHRAAVLGRAAALVGLLDRPRDLDATDLAGLFRSA